MRHLSAVLAVQLGLASFCAGVPAQQEDSTTAPAAQQTDTPVARRAEPVQAPRPAGELGMDAPPLQIARWVKGTTVTVGREGATSGVKVVEFWATWCPPCRKSIPHLTEIQKKFAQRGVEVVGITSEDPDEVEPFVQKQGEGMAYAVAVDDRRKTSNAYMGAFGVRGIPHAFVVDPQGRIAWHGHPMENLEEVVEKVVSGRWDIEAAKRSMRAEELVPGYFQQVTQGKTEEAKKTAEQILQDAGDNWVLLQRLAWTVATSPKLEGKRDMDLARRAAKAAVDATQGQNPDVLDTYARVLAETGDLEQAIATERKALELARDPEMREYLEKQLKTLQEKTTAPK